MYVNINLREVSCEALQPSRVWTGREILFQTLSCLESEKHKLRTLISILFIIQTLKYFASLLKLSQRNQLDELKIAEEWEWIKL